MSNEPISSNKVDTRAQVAAQLVGYVEPDNKASMTEDERIAWYITRFYEVYHTLASPPGYVAPDGVVVSEVQ